METETDGERQTETETESGRKGETEIEGKIIRWGVDGSRVAEHTQKNTIQLLFLSVLAVTSCQPEH